MIKSVISDQSLSVDKMMGAGPRSIRNTPNPPTKKSYDSDDPNYRLHVDQLLCHLSSKPAVGPSVPELEVNEGEKAEMETY